MRRSVASFLILLAACSNGNGSGGKQEKSAEPERKLAGVFPDRFDCRSILKDEELAALVGGGNIQKLESATPPPRGVPHPCNYVVTTNEGAQAAWTFDLDCRDGFKERADALFAQYKKTSGELVEAWNGASDAGIKPIDGGPPLKAPEPAVEVDVGSKGLDHHGQGLLFVDDDAPCYVRVVGPDASRRLELAKAVAKNLTFANAPMTPRPLTDAPASK